MSPREIAFKRQQVRFMAGTSEPSQVRHDLGMRQRILEAEVADVEKTKARGVILQVLGLTVARQEFTTLR
jgi:hypothetical protein